MIDGNAEQSCGNDNRKNYFAVVAERTYSGLALLAVPASLRG